MSKRRFFRMHLSTAVVLMLVAGVLVWANVREHERTGYHVDLTRQLSLDEWMQKDGGESIEHRRGASGFITSHGWPFNCVERDIGITDVIEWDVSKVVYNSLIALAILLAVWQVCEWRIRRNGATGSKVWSASGELF